jgi:hypothetical protein
MHNPTLGNAFGEEQNFADALYVGLGVLSFGYASGRHVEVRGIFRIQSWHLHEALEAVRCELLSLWNEYAETLPAKDGAERRLHIQGWCTLRTEPKANAPFVSLQEVIDSKYPNEKFVRTYAYPQDWWRGSRQKSELVGNQRGGDVTGILDKFSDRMIGVDFDSHNEFKKLKTYFNCLYASNADRMLVRASPSGRGLHIRLKQERSLTRETRYDVRMALGDCKGRLVCSASKQFDDVLFDMKRIKRKGHWGAWSCEEAIDSANLLALPTFSKVPREAYQR